MKGDVYQNVKRLVSVVVVLNLAHGGFLGLMLIDDSANVLADVNLPPPVGGTITITDTRTIDGSDLDDGTLDADWNLVITGGSASLRLINTTLIFQSDTTHRFYLSVAAGGKLILENSTITVQTNDRFDNYETVYWFNYSAGGFSPTKETNFKRLIPFEISITNGELTMSDNSALKYEGKLSITGSRTDISDSIISSPSAPFSTHDWGVVVQINSCSGGDRVVIADSRIEKSPWYQGISWYDQDTAGPGIVMYGNHTITNSEVYFINTYIDLDYRNKSTPHMWVLNSDDHFPPNVNPNHNALNIYTSTVKFFGLTIDMSETNNLIPTDGSTSIEVKDGVSTVALYRWLEVLPVDNKNVPVAGATVEVSTIYTGDATINALNNLNNNGPVEAYIESHSDCQLSMNGNNVRAVTGTSGKAIFGLVSDLLTNTGWPNSDQKDGYNIDASYPPSYTSEGLVNFENFPRVFSYDNYVRYTMTPFDFEAPHPELYPEFITIPPTSVLEGVKVNITVRVWNQIVGLGEDVNNVRVQFWDGDPTKNTSRMIGENIIPSIVAGTNQITWIVWNATPTGAHKIYIGVDRDFANPFQDNVIPEVNENNNVITASITVLKRPDLFINGTEIQFIVNNQPVEEVVNGTAVQIRAYVKNIGGSTAQNVLVRFYDGTAAGPGDFIGETTIASISAGATQSASVGWLPVIGLHYVWIIADEDDTVLESNENNNEGFNTLTVKSRPDLIPTLVLSPISPVYEGTLVTLTAVVANDGGWNVTTPVYVRFYRGNPDNESNYIGDGTIPLGAKGVSIPRGESGTVSITWTATYPPSGHTFWVVVDPYNTITESIETNNRDSETYTVNPRPNLVVEPSDIVFSDQYPMNGSNINVQITIWNKGLSGVTGTFYVQVWLDEIGSGTLLSELTIAGGIASGGSVTDSFNWNSVKPPGNHNIWVYIDYTNVISETNENDNIVSTSLVIIKVPSDLVVNNAIYGTLTIEDYWQTDDPWTRGGFTLVEENGHLIIRNSICKVIGQTKDNEFNIVVKDSGKLTIEDGSKITTSGKHVNIYLYDNAILTIDSSTIDTMVDIIAFDNAQIIITDQSTIKGQLYATDDAGKIMVSATNSSFINNMNNIGGNTEVHLWGVNIGGDPADENSITVADNAIVYINWYLSVMLIDINPDGYIRNADVTWIRSPPWADTGIAKTGENGMVNFWLRGMNITSSGKVWDIGSYQIVAQYTYNSVTYYPDSNIAVDMNKNKEKTIKFSQVMPDLDPPLYIDPNDTYYAVGSPSLVKAWVNNTGTNAAYDVWVKFLCNRSESRFPYAIKNDVIPAGGSWYIEFEWIPELVGWHNISIQVDPNNLIIEGNEKNNYNHSHIYVTPQKADLIITGADIYFTYPTNGPTENDTVVIHVTIHNDGETNAFPSPTLTVEYWKGNAGGPTTRLGWGNISGVVAGDSAGSSFSWVTTTPPGNYYIWVLVDPNDKVDETNELNNTASKAIYIKRYADVRPIGVAFSVEGAPVTSVSDNSKVTITATVENIGGTVATAVSVQFFDGDPDQGASSIGAVQTISSIGINKTGTASVVWTATVDGRLEVHSIYVVVSGVKENYYQNNKMSKDITVTLRPILSVIDISFSDDSPLVGEVIQIYARVTNTGGTDTTDFFVAFYDGDPDKGAQQIGGNKQLNLVVDGIGTVNVSFSSAIRGAHEIYVVADVRNDIDEADETNNIATEVIAVYSSEDIIVNNANTPQNINNMGEAFDHRGYTLVEEKGVMTISYTTFRVLQSSNYQYNIIVRNNGTLILDQGTVLNTDGISLMRVYLYDDATLIIKNSVISSNIMEILAYGNSKTYINDSTINSYIKATSTGANVRLYALNSSLSQPFQYFGGSSKAQFTNVYTPSVKLSGNAELKVYKWLKVYVRDGAGGPKVGAKVEVKHFLPPQNPIPGSPKNTGSNGMALFAVLTDIITPTMETSYLNYIISAEFNRSGETFTGSDSVSFSSYLIDKTNNIKEVSIYLMSLLPDFYVDINSISFWVNTIERLTVGLGEVVTIRATVQNIGTTDSEGVLVRFFIDLDNDGTMDSGELIHESSTSRISADGGTGVATATWTPTDKDVGESRWIRITVDPYNTVLELNEGVDNKAFTDLRIVRPPDLSITDADIYFRNSAGKAVNNATEGAIITIDLRINNLGDNPATNVNVSAFEGYPDVNPLDGKPDSPLPQGVTLIASKIIMSITPGATQVLLTWDTTQKEGDHFVYVFITDATLIDGYHIPDQNLQNNHAQKDFLVHAKPDLYVTIPSPYTTNITIMAADGKTILTEPKIGDSAVLKATVYNGGNVYVSGVTVGFYDGDPQSGGKLLGNTTNDIGPKKSTNATLDWIINAPVGDRELFVWVNRDQRVIESNPNNNIYSDTFNVQYKDFEIIFTILPPSKTKEGKTIEIRAKAQFTDTKEPLPGMTYNITIVRANTLQPYGAPVSGVTSAVGAIFVDIAAPTDAGDYQIVVEVDYGPTSVSKTHDIQVEAKPSELIPLWLILLVIIIAVVIVLLVGVALAKFGLGRLVECGECGAFIPEGEKACPKCGAVFETDTAKCSECGAWIPVESKSCPDCGAIFAGLEKEKKDYIERMKVQYQEYVNQYRGEARSNLGREPTDEEFSDWWKANPKYVGFEEWLAREEELRKGRTKPCPSCNTINPESATICFKCGTVFKEEKEEEVVEQLPPPEVPAKMVARPAEERRAAPPTVVPKKVTRPPETIPRTGVKAPPTVVPKKVVRPPEEGKPVVVPKKVVKRPPPEEEQ